MPSPTPNAGSPGPARARHRHHCGAASAAPLAGVLRLAESGELRPGSEVVVVLTGHGLKDPGVLELHGGADESPISVEAVAGALEQEARR